jgi:hypothetical protein
MGPDEGFREHVFRLYYIQAMKVHAVRHAAFGSQGSVELALIGSGNSAAILVARNWLMGAGAV